MSVSKVHAKSRKQKVIAKLSSAYCLVPMHEDIVDTVIKIMDDEGPKPMRNMRPSQKLYTGAERFQIEHHGEYEARGRWNYDKVSRVCVHNSAYPKLNDELQKKRSTAKPVAFTDQKPYRAMRADHRGTKLKSQVRQKQPRRNTIKRQKLTPAIHKPKERKYNRRSNHSVCRSSQYSRIRISRGSQCVYPKPVEKCVSTCDYDFDHERDMLVARNNFIRQFESKHDAQRIINSKKSIHATSVIGNTEEQENRSVKRKSGSQSRKSSVPSISSYNSFMSMEHEPMVE